MKFEFDPRTGMFGPAPKRPEDDIHLMNQLPAKSGWIKLLQNRVNLKSVGNIRYAKVMWYDIRTKMVSEEKDGKDGEFMRSYVLPGAGRPAGWIYVNGKNESR